MELNKVLERVSKLVAKAEDPSVTPEEAKSYRDMADSLMLKYAIEEAQLDASRPAPSRAKPGTLVVPLTVDHDLLGYVGVLADATAKACRCMIRKYTSWVTGEGWQATVYGYESDLRYFEVMYTTLRLHMIGALRPSVDPNESLDENCYRLHNAGLNWLEIAGLYGWKKDSFQVGDKNEMWYNTRTQERKSNWQVGGMHKRACQRAGKARGEAGHMVIAAGAGATFRRSAAEGYAYRLRRRLRDLESGRISEPGSELVLADRSSDLMAFFKDQNADLFMEYEPPEPCKACEKAKSGHCRAHPRGSWKEVPFSDAGYSAGVRHANTAALNPEATSRKTQAIG